MIPRWLLLALSVVVFSPGFLHAQDKVLATYWFKAVADHDQMYEDVEIFRRILDRKLEPLYPRTNTSSTTLYTLHNTIRFPQAEAIYALPASQVTYPLAIDFGWPNQPLNALAGNRLHVGTDSTFMGGETVLPSLEGVYLKGQGIVYTATLSSLQWAATTEPAKPVSEWERVRRQLHNEKEEPKKSEANKPAELSEVVLKMLAENGHHFSQLGENESLTVVLTVHGSGSSAPKSGEGSAKAKPQSPVEEKDASVSSKVRDLELLGDLHTKQEHYGMARDAFREALELKPGRKKSAELARKLAQTYLILSDIEGARRALDQALALAKEDTDTKAKPAPTANPPATALPIKLIVSAPKKLLDQVKEGKISFEEFRRQASVETLKFDGKRR